MMTSMPPAQAIGELHHGPEESLVIGVIFFTLLMASSFAAWAGSGSNSGRFPGFMVTFPSEMRDWPHPALPLGPGVRALMETLAGTGAMVIWLIGLVAIAPLASWLGFDLTTWFVSYLSRTAASRGVLLGSAMVVPCAMARLLPAGNQLIAYVRGFAVPILATVAVVIASDSVPLLLVFATVLVTALLLTARVAMIAAPFTRPAPSTRPSRSSSRAVVTFRASRPPLAQFWRDACLGPLRLTRWVLVIAAACFVLGGVLARAHVGSETLAEMLVGTPPLFIATILVWCPLGTFGARGGDQAGLFNDLNGRAWVRLPLRREWVMRAFYLHGTVTGLVFIALSVVGSKITGGLSLFFAAVPGEPADWGGLLCAIPPLAGLLTCRAAGDRVLGAISVTSLVLIWTQFPSTATWSTAALAIAGGAPPLVHLFWQPR